MSLVEIVNNVCMSELDRVASVIEGELKAACPKRSGEAASSIGIEGGGVIRRIGGTNDHLFFADQGNNQSMRVIRPVRAKALRFNDGSLHARARTYEGKHFVAEVASRHR